MTMLEALVYLNGLLLGLCIPVGFGAYGQLKKLQADVRYLEAQHRVACEDAKTLRQELDTLRMGG